MTHTTYRTANVDGFEVFYREAGDPAKPTLLLSSTMARQLACVSRWLTRSG